jgi:hypothetical protein
MGVWAVACDATLSIRIEGAFEASSQIDGGTRMCNVPYVYIDGVRRDFMPAPNL